MSLLAVVGFLCFLVGVLVGIVIRDAIDLIRNNYRSGDPT